MSSSVKNFDEWLPFKNNGNNELKNDVIIKYHSEWIEKYPELKALKLESEYLSKKWYWNYTMNKTIEKMNIDLFIEIVKNNDNWDISFEMSTECEEEDLNRYKSNIQDEKHFEKNELDWEELNLNLKKICEWIRVWNHSFYKKYNVYILNK